MATIILTDAQLNRALRDAAFFAVNHFCRLQGMEVADASLITGAQAMEMLKVTRPTLYALAERGEIKRHKVGGVWKYDVVSINDYLAK